MSGRCKGATDRGNPDPDRHTTNLQTALHRGGAAEESARGRQVGQLGHLRRTETKSNTGRAAWVMGTGMGQIHQDALL